MRRIKLIVALLILGIAVAFPSPLRSAEAFSLPDIAKPQSIDCYGKELFIVEDASIFVYSLDNYKLRGKFGQKGSGPGEFETNDYIILRISLDDDGVFLNTNYKMARFSRQGKLLWEKKLPFFAFRIMPLGKNFAVTKTFLNKKGENQLGIVVMDARLETLTTPYYRGYMDYTRMKSFSIIPDFIYTRVYRNRLYVFDNRGDFTIHVYDSSGTPREKFSLDYEKVKVNGERKAEIMEWMDNASMFKAMPDNYRKMMTLPDYFPVVRDFVISDQRIYVLTFNQKDGKAEFIILSMKGEELKRIFLPLPRSAVNPVKPIPFTFHNGRYLYLEENIEDELWELHIEKVF